MMAASFCDVDLGSCDAFSADIKVPIPRLGYEASSLAPADRSQRSEGHLSELKSLWIRHVVNSNSESEVAGSRVAAVGRCSPAVKRSEFLQLVHRRQAIARYRKKRQRRAGLLSDVAKSATGSPRFARSEVGTRIPRRTGVPELLTFPVEASTKSRRKATRASKAPASKRFRSTPVTPTVEAGAPVVPNAVLDTAPAARGSSLALDSHFPAAPCSSEAVDAKSTVTDDEDFSFGGMCFFLD